MSMDNKEESEEERLERLSDEKFMRTGVSTFSFKVKIKVTENDMKRALIKEIEGKSLTPDPENIITKN